MALRAAWVSLLAGCGMLAVGCTTEETPVTAEVHITPASHSLAPGTMVSLHAGALDREGNPLSGRPATWSSQIPAIATVGVRSGLVTALIPGTVGVSATIDGITATALITVAYPAPQVRSIRIEPESATLRTGDTQEFTATALDAEGNPIPGRSAIWESSAPSVATILGAGRIRAGGEGLAVIFARIDDHTGVVVVNVAPRAVRVEVSGRNLLDEVADTTQLAALVRDVDGNLLDAWPVQWASSDPSVAKVDAFGKVSSQSPGSAVITATSESAIGAVQVTVSRLPVAAVSILGTGFLFTNRTFQLQATATSAGGQVLRGRSATTWTSSNPVVATISASGLLSSLAVGTTTISAVVEGIHGERGMEVVDFRGPSLSLGVWHSCSLAGSGQIQCWGSRPAAGLGQDTCFDVTYYNTQFPCTRTPTPVTGGAQLVTVAAGSWHTCGLTAAGTAWCWGNNWSGELGVAAPSTEAPIQVSGGHSFVSLALGYQFSCGLEPEGKVYCWGSNSVGQLGNGSLASTSSPTLVAGGHSFVQLTAGEAHACGVTQASKVYCWGENQFGQLGEGTLIKSATPTAVTNSQTFVEVEAGAYHTCALDLAGAAWCWGYGLYGQIGDGIRASRLAPVAVTGGHQWHSLSAGGFSTCGTRFDGAGFCWGSNSYGQLGVGGTSDSAAPKLVAGSLSFVELVTGGTHTCGRSGAGAVYCWGLGMTGALGLGTEVGDQSVPKQTLGNP